MSTVPVAADGGIVGWVVGLMETLGAPGVGLAIALESVFPPLPSEVFLPLAGFAAARGDMSVLAAIIWTTLGSLAGALVLYGVGAALGRERLMAIADRMPLVAVADVVKAEEWFARHGPKAVFLGRMVPLVRSLVSVPAGLERMPLPLFAALTTAGSLIWNTAFVLAGYGLGANFGLIEPYMSVVSKVVVGLIAGAVAWWVTRRVLARRAATDPTGDGPAAEPPVAAGRLEVPAPVVLTPTALPGRPSAPERVPDATRVGLPRVGSFDDVETVRLRVLEARVDDRTVRLDRRDAHPPAPPRRPHPAPHPRAHPPGPWPSGPRQPHPPVGPHPHAHLPPHVRERPRPAPER